MSAPGDQVINAPFSVGLKRKIYLGQYETEEIEFRADFMYQPPNQALVYIRSVMDPWVQQAKASIKSINDINQSKQSPLKPTSPMAPTRQGLQAGQFQREDAKATTTIQTCNRCHAPLKMKDGKIDWAKGDQMGQFFPKNPDGSRHRC